MPERFAKSESSSLRERSLEERLKAYPELKAKIEAMLSIIENSGGDVEKAAEAMIEELRQMGNESPAPLGAASAAKEGRRT